MGGSIQFDDGLPVQDPLLSVKAVSLTLGHIDVLRLDTWMAPQTALGRLPAGGFINGAIVLAMVKK